MGNAPRPWQRSLSNLSVTSKVGIVLLLPVVLASAFGVLRIKDELSTISQLNTASEQARIIRPMLNYSTAANQLAVTAAASGGAGDRSAQPALDQDAAHFDQALADLQAALQVSQLDKRVTTAITNALAAGRTLRDSRHGTAPFQIGRQADEVSTHIDTAITALPTPKETAIERYYVQMGVIAIARQMFTQEQLWIISGDLGNNPALVAQALLSAGGESATIHQYAAVYPETAEKPDVLLAALQTRVDALSQGTAEPISVPGVAESLQTSAGIYADSTDRLVDLIDTSLAERLTDARGQVLRDVALVVVTLLAGLALALAVARSLVIPVRRLRRDALQVAHTDLPAELAVVRGGGATPEIVPVDVQTTEEIGQLARAVDDMHRQALHLAADQARLRLQISSMFETLSRRSQSLVEQQLNLIEDLERDEDNSERLQSLFRLDHLATRMRRNGDNLLVLAGTALRRGHLPPVPLSDMLWSAVSQVEDYQRVEIGAVPDGVVAGEPAVDIEHLLAELIDNSLRYSPPTTPVAVSVTRAVDGGYLIEITDRGLGMSAEDLRTINERLASGGEVTIETARRMGLFVVGRLATRHTITVSLRRTSAVTHQSGITASVHLPGPLVSPTPGAAGGPQPITATFAPLTSGPEITEPTAPQRSSGAASAQADFGAFGTTGSGLPQRRPAEPAPPGDTSADIPFALPQRGAADRQAEDDNATGTWPPIASPDGPTQHLPTLNMWSGTGDRTTPSQSEEHDYLSGEHNAISTEHDYLANRRTASAAEEWDETATPAEQWDSTTAPAEQRDNRTAPAEQWGNAATPARQWDDTATPADQRDNAATPAGQWENTEGSAGQRDTSTPAEQWDNTTAPAERWNDTTASAGQRDKSTASAEQWNDTAAPAGQRDDTTTPAERWDDTTTPASGTAALPNRHSALPNRTPALENQSTPLPDRHATLPDRSTPLPDRAATLGNRNTPLPNREATLSDRDTALPDRDAGLPNRSTALPSRAAAFANRESALPNRDTAAAGQSDSASSTPGPTTPIYQRMVSEWLVEPSSSSPAEMWNSPADEGWAAAADAVRPPTDARTTGGLPIRRPGAQLVPGGLAPATDAGAPDPEEIRNNLSRHLSGVRSGRADAQHNDDGGLR
nr:ATP-binding protein [Nocardia wallacei]